MGLAYLAAVLDRAGFACGVIDANRVVERIPPETKMIGFAVNSFSYNSVRGLVDVCRRRREKAGLILGGGRQKPARSSRSK